MNYIKIVAVLLPLVLKRNMPKLTQAYMIYLHSSSTSFPNISKHRQSTKWVSAWKSTGSRRTFGERSWQSHAVTQVARCISQCLGVCTHVSMYSNTSQHKGCKERHVHTLPFREDSARDRHCFASSVAFLAHEMDGARGDRSNGIRNEAREFNVWWLRFNACKNIGHHATPYHARSSQTVIRHRQGYPRLDS